jgi:hypothetical protein
MGNENSSATMEVDVDAEIKRLKIETGGLVSDVNTSKIDKFMNSAREMTYYYKNISQLALVFGDISDNQKFPLRPGMVVDFKEYFKEDKDILNSSEIRNYEKPKNNIPYIMRLTPAEYLSELKIQSALEREQYEKKVESHKSQSKSGDTSVSPNIQDKVNELLRYENYTAEDKVKSGYSYSQFYQWLRGIIFKEHEYRWMNLEIKNNEVLGKLLERKEELLRLGQYK